MLTAGLEPPRDSLNRCGHAVPARSNPSSEITMFRSSLGASGIFLAVVCLFASGSLVSFAFAHVTLRTQRSAGRRILQGGAARAARLRRLADDGNPRSYSRGHDRRQTDAQTRLDALISSKGSTPRLTACFALRSAKV